MKMHKSSLIAFASVLGVLVMHAEAAEPKTVFYDLTSDDATGAEKLLNKANRDLASGHEVIIKLGNIAPLTTSEGTVFDTTYSDFPLTEGLESAMQNGAKVIICPLWMREANMSATDLVAGIAINESDVVGDSIDLLACTP